VGLTKKLSKTKVIVLLEARASLVFTFTPNAPLATRAQ
jgi:hypothetical protein